MNRDVYMAHARKEIEHDTLVQPRMTKAEFIERATKIIEEAQMHACGIDDLHGAGLVPKDYADEIADILPPYVFG